MDLFIFTNEFLNEKLQFLCNAKETMLSYSVHIQEHNDQIKLFVFYPVSSYTHFIEYLGDMIWSV